MVRDASVKTQDMLVLDEMDMTVFNKESVRSYRQRMRLSRPGHVWEALEDEDFLLKLGAVGIGSDGKKHPTSAGLLMFGNEYDIVRDFWIIRSSMMPTPAGQTGSFPPPATGAAMCTTSISASITS